MQLKDTVVKEQSNHLKNEKMLFDWNNMSQKSIMSAWKDGNPTVSVSCLTYNHAKYIEQCLQSILMQRTTFPFEIVIHDDASVDGTAEIIKHYQKRYPQIIKPIFETVNQSADRNVDVQLRMYHNMSGRYIAFCEGDDYWVDNYKLQKQYDFLEKNREYVVVGNLTKVFNQIDEEIETFVDSKAGEYTIDDLNEWRLFAHFSSYFARNFCRYLSEEDLFTYLSLNCPGDRKFPFLFFKLGKLYVLPFWGTVYRYQSSKGSYTQSKNFGNRIVQWEELREVSAYANISGVCFDRRIRERELIMFLLIDAIVGKNREDYAMVRKERNSTIVKDIKYCGGYFLFRAMLYIKKRIRRIIHSI